MLDATDVITVVLILIALLGIAQWYHYIKNFLDGE